MADKLGYGGESLSWPSSGKSKTYRNKTDRSKSFDWPSSEEVKDDDLTARQKSILKPTAKSDTPKKTGAAPAKPKKRKSASSPTAGKDAEKLGKFRERTSDQDLAEGLGNAQKEEALTKAKNPDRSKAETVSTAPREAPQFSKKRSKLRRAVAGIGRGFRKAFGDNSKTELAKNKTKSSTKRVS